MGDDEERTFEIGGDVARIRRIGLRREPSGGWPLDELFVGVATMRTVREFFRQQNGRREALRAWDVALWSGVTPQGTTHSLDRLARLGLAETIPSPGYGRAKTFRLERKHPLVRPVYRLLAAERAVAGPMRRTMKSAADQHDTGILSSEL